MSHIINFTITIPDDQEDRVIAGMQTHYGQVQDGTDPETGEPVFRDLTGAEIVQRIKGETRQRIIDIVRSVENQAAARAAIQAVSDVEAE
jgi:hypothetical protein